MLDPESHTIEATVETLAAELADHVTWKWDGRFSVALAEFAVSQSQAIRSVIDRFFPAVWDSSSVSEACDMVLGTRQRLGGLMPGQLLFTPEHPLEGSLFCAWWPWGNGTTISIRIGLVGGSDASPELPKEPFGIE